MTLIAALPFSDGVVVCADSQETAGDYKAETNKLSIETAGPYEVLFAGAGNKASLIDGLCDRIIAELSHGGDPAATMTAHSWIGLSAL